MLRLSLMGFWNDTLAGECLQRITMVISWLLKKDFKLLSRQVKGAGNISLPLVFPGSQ